MHRSVQNRYAVLAFGTFTFTCVGIIYGWSKFSAAIRADLALNHAQITLAYTISIAMFSLGIALDGLLSRLCSVKTSVTAACLMTGGGFLVSSFLTAGGRFALYAVYGLLVGLGMGIIYGGWLSNIMVWFPGGRGLTTGVLLTAIGFSGLTITPVFASLASAHGWRISFRLIGVLFFVIAALSPLFLAPSARRPAENAAPSAPASGYSTAEVLRQREFWFFCIWKLLLVSVGQAFLGQLAPIIADIRGSDALQLLPCRVHQRYQPYPVGLVFRRVGLPQGTPFDRHGRRRIHSRALVFPPHGKPSHDILFPAFVLRHLRRRSLDRSELYPHLLRCQGFPHQ